MLTPPEGLSDDALVRVLGNGWGVAVASIDYRPLGFGSHHWEVMDGDGARWFVTVDDLDGNRRSASEPEGSAFGRLRAALATAGDLRASGATFVVAPVPTRAGEPLMPVEPRFGVALYPFVDGQSFSWGDFSSTEHRRGVLDLIVALHTAPAAASRHALAEDFTIPHRDELEANANEHHHRGDRGPYATPTSALLRENETKLRSLLARHDDLVNAARGRPGPMVLTHGEPHPGNTMLTSRGWVLIDWDTVLLAPPERDLWMLDPGNGSLLDSYAAATGTTPERPTIELYRMRWDLADIAVYVSRFRAPHTGNRDDEKSWDGLRSLVGRLPA